MTENCEPTLENWKAEALKSREEKAELQRKLESVIYDLTLEQEKMKKMEQLVDSYENSLSNLGYQDMKAKLRKAEDLLHQCGQQKEIYRQETIRWKEAYEPLNEKHKKAEAVVEAAKEFELWTHIPESFEQSIVERVCDNQQRGLKLLKLALASYEGKEGL